MPKRGLVNPGRVSAVARRYAKRNPAGLSRNCQGMRCFGRGMLAARIASGCLSPSRLCSRADRKRRGRMYRGSGPIQPEAARFRRRLWLLVMLSAQAAAPGSAPATTRAEGEWGARRAKRRASRSLRLSRRRPPRPLLRPQRSGGLSAEAMEQLQQLGQLREQGILPTPSSRSRSRRSCRACEEERDDDRTGADAGDRLRGSPVQGAGRGQVAFLTRCLRPRRLPSTSPPVGRAGTRTRRWLRQGNQRPGRSRCCST